MGIEEDLKNLKTPTGERGRGDGSPIPFPGLRAFTPPKHTYFFYGYADEMSIPGLCHQAEDDGCDIITILPSMIPAPKGLILPPGAPAVITVLKLFVRCPRSEFDALQAKIKAGNG